MPRWRIWLLFVMLLLLPAVANAQMSDACGTAYAKQSFKATIASATTTKLIAGSANKNIHLCGLKVENVGSASTWKLQTGTGTTCGTGTVDLTPAFGGTDTAVATAGNGNTVMGFANNELFDTGFSVSGADLCLVSGGTITDIWVFGSYVLQ